MIYNGFRLFKCLSKKKKKNEQELAAKTKITN